MISQLHRKLSSEIEHINTAVSFCFQLSWKTSRKYTIFELITSVIMSILPFFSLFLSKYMFDYLVIPNYHANYVIDILILVTSINIAGVVLRQVLNYVKIIHGELMQYEIQRSIMKKSMSMDIGFFDSPDYMDAMQALKNDAMRLPNCLWNVLACVNCGISSVYAFILLSNISILLATIVSALAFPAAILSRKYAKELYDCRLSLISEMRQLGYLQLISGHETFSCDIRLFNLTEYILDKYKNLSHNIVERERNVAHRSIFGKLFFALLPQFGIFLILVVIIDRICGGILTVGDYMLYSGLLSTLTNSIAQFINSLVGIYEDKLRIFTIKRFESRSNSITDDGTIELKEIEDIVFMNVFFHYPGSEKDTIKDLSFRITQNERICIVGLNGSGKSTIIKLMLRFYDVTSGAILINGINIKEYTIASLRRNFSVLFQTYDKYAFSLRDNISLSDISRAPEGDVAVFDALNNAGGHDVLNKVNNNLDVLLSRLFSPLGIELSVGELQKIALARAIYRKSSVMILDEPSASLDPYAENQILENIKECTHGKIVFFTAHRLNTVFIADRIFVLEAGTVVEAGTHEELLCQHGKYADFFQSQARKYFNKTQIEL